jgi:ATP-dependent exoDNAse (exonuclease V) beta subunit
VEYPLAGPTNGGKLLRGYADLVHVGEREIRIVDFKTDAAGDQPSTAVFPDYLEQVRTYASLLGPVAGGREVSGALLFSATGRLEIAT